MSNDGGSAFPRLSGMRDRGVGGRHYEAEHIGGMTLRDYFAGQVIGAYLYERFSGNHTWEPDQIAEWSYELADAMLAEREKGR